MRREETEILFEYLRRILYERETPMLDERAVSAECSELVKGMNLLQVWLRENADFADSIAMGKLQANEPSKENPLCDSLKMIRSNLAHLSWQTKQVAGGDYSQKVAMMGDFSEAFNTMTEQLKQREEALFQHNALLSCITDNIEEAVVVLAKKTGDVLYGNKAFLNLITGDVLSTEGIRAILEEYKEDTPRYSWEKQLELEGRNVYLQIVSIQIDWLGQNARVYLLRDITEQKEREIIIEKEANSDVMTGLYNRRFCMKKLDELAGKKIPFSICFIDLDGLKAVNDNYGHDAGDEYIQVAAGLLKKFFRREDILCRIGGDEFIIIMPRCPQKYLETRMEQVRSQLFKMAKEYEYVMGISYGTSGYDGGDRNVEEILEEADTRMYAFKQKNRWRGED